MYAEEAMVKVRQIRETDDCDADGYLERRVSGMVPGASGVYVGRVKADERIE